MLWWLSSIRIPKSNGSQAIKRWLRSVRIFNLTDTKSFTLQIGLKIFVSQSNTQWNYLMAASCIVLLPIIIVFMCLQKYFTEGMNLGGAVKG